MRTTAKMYRFTIFFDRVIPQLLDDDGALRFRVSCRSLRSAEKYARQHAEIVSRGDLTRPIRCIIEYNTQAGRKTHELIFEGGRDDD